MATANYDCVKRQCQFRLEGGASWGRADWKADWPESQLMHFMKQGQAQHFDGVTTVELPDEEPTRPKSAPAKVKTLGYQEALKIVVKIEVKP